MLHAGSLLAHALRNPAFRLVLPKEVLLLTAETLREITSFPQGHKYARRFDRANEAVHLGYEAHAVGDAMRALAGYRSKLTFLMAV